MFTITTPIPYANAAPHLGHLLEGIFNDTIARFYRRSQSDQVNLTMGLDQHGLKIYQKALEAGQTPEEFCKEQGQKFIDLWEQFEVRYDTFIQTEDKYHKAMAQIIWKRLVKNGYIFKKAYEGLYCVGCEDFYAPSQLTEDGKCPIHLSEPIKTSEENYFFKLSELSEPILEFLKSADIKPEHARLEWINFVESGLQDVSCSRQKDRLPWGIEVPDDASQVMYVWIDALVNYLTASVNPETLDRWIELPYAQEEIEPEIFAELLDAFPTQVMYCGKDIAKFHLVVYTGILSAIGLDLPERALVHGFINDGEGRKFSKTLNNGVFPHELIEKIGVDGSRFVILHEVNVDGDTNFDWTRILEAYNSHLANNIGNLAMRVSTLVEKLMDGYVDLESFDPKAESNQNYVFDFSPTYTHLNRLEPREALDVILKRASFGNELLEQTKPWQLAKEGKNEEMKVILTSLCYLLKEIGEILSIFLPESGDKIYQIFSAPKISKAQVLFPKVELE